MVAQRAAGNPLPIARPPVKAGTMRKIYYSGGSVVVSDQVCKAILRYARALAQAHTADLVVFPAFTNENRRGMAHILVGPSSQLLSVPWDDVGVNLDDAGMVEILEARTVKLDPGRPAWGEDVMDVEGPSSFDWDF